MVRPVLINGSKLLYDKLGRDLSTTDMKMCRMSLDVTKLDNITSHHFRNTLDIKVTIVDNQRKIGSLKSIRKMKLVLEEKSFPTCVTGADKKAVGLLKCDNNSDRAYNK